MRRLVAVAMATLALLAGCGKKPKAARVPAPPPRTAPKAIPRPPGWTETGIASWYGHPYHGRQAANGEVYDMNGMTAAHRTLPFDTWVRVTNLTNLRQVEVRITDRGPFIDGRILDLSRRAAELLDMVIAGLAKVRVEVIAPPAPPPPPVASSPQTAPAPHPSEAAPAALPRFTVQVVALREASAAHAVRRSLEREYGVARVHPRESPPVFRVQVGEFTSRQAADEFAVRLGREHPEFSGAFVVAIE